jgi:hypothetical protein
MTRKLKGPISQHGVNGAISSTVTSGRFWDMQKTWGGGTRSERVV